MKWNDAEIYFASEATTSERHWEMEKDESGKYALIREEKLIGVFDNTASAIEEGHRRFGSNFLIKQIDEKGNEVFLEVLPAFPDDDEGE